MAKEFKNIAGALANGFSAPFEVKSYALERKKSAGGGVDLAIVPCDTGYAEFKRAYSSGEETLYRVANPVMKATGEDEGVFMLKAAAKGFAPDLKFSYGEERECTDIVDVKTGESLMEKRKSAISAKLQDTEPSPDYQLDGTCLPDEMADVFYEPESYAE